MTPKTATQNPQWNVEKRDSILSSSPFRQHGISTRAASAEEVAKREAKALNRVRIGEVLRITSLTNPRKAWMYQIGRDGKVREVKR